MASFLFEVSRPYRRQKSPVPRSLGAREPCCVSWTQPLALFKHSPGGTEVKPTICKSSAIELHRFKRSATRVPSSGPELKNIFLQPILSLPCTALPVHFSLQHMYFRSLFPSLLHPPGPPPPTTTPTTNRPLSFNWVCTLLLRLTQTMLRCCMVDE